MPEQPWTTALQTPLCAHTECSETSSQSSPLSLQLASFALGDTARSRHLAGLAWKRSAGTDVKANGSWGLRGGAKGTPRPLLSPHIRTESEAATQASAGSRLFSANDVRTPRASYRRAR